MKPYIISGALALLMTCFLLGFAGLFLTITGSALAFYAWVTFHQVKLNQRAYEAEIRNREVDAEFRHVVVSKIGVLAYNSGNLSFWSRRESQPDRSDTLLEDASPEPAGNHQTLFDVLTRLDRVLIIGGMGSGKSELLKWLVSERAKQGEIIILDSHAAPDTWPFGQVVGLGRDYPAIENAVRSVCAEMDERYKLRSSGQQKDFPQLCMVIDEMTVLNQFTGLSDEIKSLLCECRKVNIKLIAAGQSDRAGAMGLKGNYDLMTGFEAVCYLESDSTGERYGNVLFGRSKTPERFPHPGIFPAWMTGTSRQHGQEYAPKTHSDGFAAYRDGVQYLPAGTGETFTGIEPEAVSRVYESRDEKTICEMWRDGHSLNEIARSIWGTSNGRRTGQIKAVLENNGFVL
ncbi:MAG: type IV secretory system conjugative DNA transfer family protein [Desulfobacterales bacterium]